MDDRGNIKSLDSFKSMYGVELRDVTEPLNTSMLNQKLAKLVPIENAKLLDELNGMNRKQRRDWYRKNRNKL